MKLKYVGDKPKVSQHGVTFDHTKVDKYTYLNAAVELLEALSYGATESTKHLYRTQNDEYDADELLRLLKKFCKNIEKVFDEQEDKSKEFIASMMQRVNENDSLSYDDKKAWVTNMKMMREYYFQFITNQSAYECALHSLVDEIVVAQVQKVEVPLFRNYGIILTDLKPLLETRKPPVDMNMTVKQGDQGLIAVITISHN